MIVILSLIISRMITMASTQLLWMAGGLPYWEDVVGGVADLGVDAGNWLNKAAGGAVPVAAHHVREADAACA